MHSNSSVTDLPPSGAVEGDAACSSSMTGSVCISAEASSTSFRFKGSKGVLFHLDLRLISLLSRLVLCLVPGKERQNVDHGQGSSFWWGRKGPLEANRDRRDS